MIAIPLVVSAALFAAPALATSPFAAPVAATSPLSHELTVDKLPNGLTVVTVPTVSPGVVSYFTLVRAGSRDEVEPGKSGYAHLFEHLMFRGSEKMSAAEYEQKMQALGADNNAFTTDDFTLYVPTIPKESLADLVAIDADRFAHLSYSRASYKDETGAVLGEYNKNASNPALLMEEAIRGIAFTRHTYGHTTLGNKKDVDAMPAAYDYSRAFWKRFYTPDDCTIFAVGDVERANVVNLVRAAYKDWTGSRANTAALPEPEQKEPRARALTWKGPTPPRLMEGFKIPAAGASIADTAALVLVSELVLGESSPLYQSLVVKAQKLIDLSIDVDDLLHKDAGLFVFTAKLKPTTGFDEVVRAVDDAFAKVARGETSAERLEAVRSHVRNAIPLSLQTSQQIAIAVASWMALTGDPHAFEAYAAALDRVTADDVARVTRTYLVPARRNVVTLSPPAAPAPARTK